MLHLLPDNIEQYALEHTSPLPPPFGELIATTRGLGRSAAMLSGPLEGTLLQMLAFSIGARRILELGTFTGFSALMMATALPDDGELITCDVDPNTTALARAAWAKSPHGHKITSRLGPALETIKTLQGPFDLIFIDADKPAYPDYYAATLPLLAPRGLMVVDNVLRQGYVLSPRSDGDRAVAAFNEQVRQDSRVQQVLLTIRDGIMLIRRLEA